MPNAAQPHALGRLIREVQQANGWSYADISANALRAGRRLSRSRVESLRNDPLTSIGIKAIEALAAGLAVTPGRVVDAAIESMGYQSTDQDSPPSSAEALRNDPLLSASTRRVLIAALEAAHEEYHQSNPVRDSPSRAKRPRRRAGAKDNAIEDVAADED